MNYDYLFIAGGILSLSFIIWLIFSINKINSNLEKHHNLLECLVSNTNREKSPVNLKLAKTFETMHDMKKFDGREFESLAHAELFLRQNEIEDGIFDIISKTK